jgi:hypothetical protein
MYLYWWEEPKTLGEFAGEVQGYVRAIEPIDEFSKFLFDGRRSKSVHASAQDPDLVPRLVAESGLFDRRYPYEGLDETGKPVPSSTARWGLTLSWRTPGHHDEAVRFSLSDGKTDLAAYPAKFMVDFAEGRFPQATVDQLFRETIRYWRPAIACLTSDVLRKAADTMTFEPIEAGWRTYVGWKDAANAPQGATVEQIPPGGSLITLLGDHPDAGNQQQVDALRALHRSLSSSTIGFVRLKRRIPGNSSVYGRGRSAG